MNDPFLLPRLSSKAHITGPSGVWLSSNQPALHNHKGGVQRGALLVSFQNSLALWGWNRRPKEKLKNLHCRFVKHDTRPAHAFQPMFSRDSGGGGSHFWTQTLPTVLPGGTDGMPLPERPRRSAVGSSPGCDP